MHISNKRPARNYTTAHHKTTKKKSVKKTKTNGSPASKKGKSIFAFLKSERMIQIYGLLLIIFSLLLLVSIVSYLFTQSADVTFINDSGGDAKPGNIGGVVGAYLAHFFVNYFFGIFSLGFVLLFFLYGLKLTFGKEPLSLVKYSITILLTMAWLSMFTGFFVEGTDKEYFAGIFGNFTASYLIDKTGKLVTSLIAIASFLIIAILGYDFSVQHLAAIPGRIRIPKRSGSGLKERKEKKRKNIPDVNGEYTGYLAAGNADTELPGLYIENRNGLQEEYTGNVIHFDDDNDNDNINESKHDYAKEDIPATVVVEDEVPFEIFDNALKTDEAGDEPEEIEVPALENLTAQHPGLLEDFDPRKDLSTYQFPGMELLKDYSSKEVDAEIMRKELVENKVKIETTLKNFNIPIKSITATIGPTVTLYEIVPTEGIRINKIKNLEDDIALSLAALGIRIIAPIPGKGTIGIEVPNRNPKIVSMREIIDSEKFKNNKFDLPIGLGKTISNEPFVVDLAKMPHMLMAGATGQGKSVGLNAVIASLLYTKHPSELKFVMIDPKKVEFSLYSAIERHYLAKVPDIEEPIITDTKKVIRTLNSLCKEMDDRYDLLKSAKTRNIKEYNAKFCARQLSPANGHRFLPYIVLLIDEFGDLIMTAGREVEMPIARLAQLARAIGIHLIIATQRPSVNIITGTIKANFPARLAFRVSSKIDSRTILDGNGADQLIGKGDMLISTGSDLIRLQCAFVDTPEVEKIVKHIEDQQGYPEAFLLPDAPEESKNSETSEEISSDKIDDFFMDAASLIVQSQQGSTSLIQRKLSLGYNRAGRIMDQLEEFGIVGPSAGSKAREVKVHSTEELREIFVRIGLL